MSCAELPWTIIVLVLTLENEFADNLCLIRREFILHHHFNSFAYKFVIKCAANSWETG